MGVEASGTGWQAAGVNEIPPVKPDWPATWKSVRHHFGITAFGVNAVTKDAGNVLIPEHDESESGQQELYFVHAGAVTATLGGETVDVPAGGFIAVEPGTRRKIESTASPTTLVCVGATPGAAYEVGEWEK
jgi:mannose-6-phosphate isomerase-like protein (cupin superfamily)